MSQVLPMAEVTSVSPDKVTITVDDINALSQNGERLRIGNLLRIGDSGDTVLIASIDNFNLEVTERGDKHKIEATPLGIIRDGAFVRGGDSIALPPKRVEAATPKDIKIMYGSSISNNASFSFASTTDTESIDIPVDGNKLFNKHIAIVGSTGSGKSNAVASIIQQAQRCKNDGACSLANSHVVIFDIHSEYKTAFPDANLLDISELAVPYWMMNSDELEELFLESGDNNNYNQSSILRDVITANKKKHNTGEAVVHYDSPVPFDVIEVLNCLENLRNETVNYRNPLRYMIKDESYAVKDQKPDINDGIELIGDARYTKYFKTVYEFHPPKSQNISRGDYADGSIDKFVDRMRSKVSQSRLSFLFGERSTGITHEDAVKQFVGYGSSKANITIIDISGVPFEVLSITVSLISRILFDFGFRYKKLVSRNNPLGHNVPLLVVYEEAHKYVPQSDLSRFKSSRNAIERIAKEGRKYGVTLMLASQRPSEISETIFSQCSTFIAMRLTNPTDQAYVKRLLPDGFGSLTSKLSSLQTGEALLIGDSLAIPSWAKIALPSPAPSSQDIPYLEIWKREWHDLLDFDFCTKLL